MGRFAQTRWARMSSGQYCLIRDLGLVKGGKGLRHHEVVLTLSLRGVIAFGITVLRESRWREAGRGLVGRGLLGRGILGRGLLGRGLFGMVRGFGRTRPEAGSESNQGLHQPDIAAEI